MVVVPPGRLLMGSPKTEPGRNEDEDDEAGEGGEPVRVEFKTPFAVARFEVSFSEWEACYRDGGCKARPPRSQGEKADQPVVNVSWTDITEQFLPWLNKKISGNADGPYRLLSEAEWEYAARAETLWAYWFGDSIDKEKVNVTTLNTMPVGSLAANPWGLHHVHGNVWEWVQDCYLDNYKNAPKDGTSLPADCPAARVVRGGSFTNAPADLRSAKRLAVGSSSHNRDIGFRLGRALKFETAPIVEGNARDGDASRAVRLK